LKTMCRMLLAMNTPTPESKIGSQRETSEIITDSLK
jgi:hypothetical protein